MGRRGVNCAESIAKERIERAARLYRTSRDAAIALNVTPSAFSRLCKRHGIETPRERHRREDEERQQRREQCE